MNDTASAGSPIKFLSFHLDETGKKVIAAFHPQGETGSITANEFKAALKHAGYGEYAQHEPSIEIAVGRYNSHVDFDMPVAIAVDGKFTLRADLMHAYLTVEPAKGGAPVQIAAIMQEVEKRGLSSTLNIDTVNKTLKEGGFGVIVASGVPPEHGKDGWFENLIPSIKQRTPHLDEHGMADFRDLGEIVSVRAGEPVMRLHPPTEGKPGKQLDGKVVPAKNGKVVAFTKHMEGVSISPNDPNLMVSGISGVPVLLNDGVKVEPVYSVKDVDLHTGNIVFDGTVKIAGDIHAGMTVKVSGDLFVEGTVEGAMIEVGGDIVIKGGIIGSSDQRAKTDEKSHPYIKCTGSCTARFVQNAHISAGDGIFINDTAIMSDLTAAHQIIVGDEGSQKGSIIGGIARAAMLLKANALGNEDGVKTVIIAGADKILHEGLDAAIKTREAAEKKFSDILRILEVNRLKPGVLPPATVHAAEVTRDLSAAEMESLRQDERELRRQIELASTARVEIKKKIHAGTEVVFGLKHYSVSKDREGGAFHLKDGDLVFE